MSLLVLNHSEVERLLPIRDCVPVMKEALCSLARGELFQPLRTIVSPRGAAGLMGLMPSYRAGEQAAYAVKVVCVFPENSKRGLDPHQGSVMLFSGETGELLAMMNASAITAIRTAAVSAVATDALARADASELAILGSGVQARAHLEAISCVRAINRARIASREFSHARKFAEDLGPRYSFPVEPVESAQEAVTGADLIVTATTAREPILRREWISAGAHLNVVGSSIPTTREIDGELMAAASLFVDRRESTVNEGGDYLFALSEGAIGPDAIRAEVGEVLIGAARGRISADEITVFKSLGLAIEDLASAEYLYRKAVESRAGAWFDY